MKPINTRKIAQPVNNLKTTNAQNFDVLVEGVEIGGMHNNGVRDNGGVECCQK